MEKNLEVMVKESGLDKTKADFILEKFKSYFAIASEWENKAKEILVTDESQKDIMAIAREGRLALKEKRVDLEKDRKALKEQSLREGKAIDGISNVLKALIIPIEEHLDRQEHFAEYKQKAIDDAHRAEVEKRMEEERIAKEKAEAEEQKRIKAENEKLKAEVVEREKIAIMERKKNDLALAAERSKADAEKKAIEDKAKKDREEDQKKIDEAQAKLIVLQAKERGSGNIKIKRDIICPFCLEKFEIEK